ncbi:chitin deacetylase-like 5 [Haemaphysalis longicornis]
MAWITALFAPCQYLLLLALLVCVAAPRNTEGAPSDEFKCPEQFGYYADEGDCSKYFVCVFGDALHESCTGGLYFSVELQTCDWPRNVQCAGASRKATTAAPKKEERFTGSQRRSGTRKASSGRQTSETVRPSRFRGRPTTTVRTTTTTLRTTTTPAPPPATRRLHVPTPTPEYQTLYDEDESKHSSEDEEESEEEGDEDSGSTEAPDEHDTVSPSLQEAPRKNVGPKSNSYDPQQPQYDEAVPTLVNSDGKILGSDGGRPDKFIPGSGQKQQQPSQQSGQKQQDSLSVFVKPLYRNTGDQKDKESDQVFKRDQTAILAAPNPHDLDDDVIIPSVYGGNSARAPSLGSQDVGGRKDVVLVTYPRDQNRYQYSSGAAGTYSDDENEFRAFLQDQQRQQLPGSQPDVQRVLSDSSVRPSSRGRNRDARYYPRLQQQHVPQQTLVSQIPPPQHVTVQRPQAPQQQLQPQLPVTQTYSYDKYPATPQRAAVATQAPPATRAPAYPAYQDYDHNYQLQSEYAYPDEEEPYPTTTTPRPTRRIKYRTTTTTSTTTTTTTTTPRPVPTRRPPPKGFSRPATRPPVPTTPAPPAARPRNLYATPTPLETAGRCEARKCRLPDCHCGGSEIPGDLPLHETPQVVLLTFDDAINDLNFDHYTEIFDTGRKNPNGCPIRGTFYVSHEWTDYGQVQTLYSKGHEMASHTVTHSFGEKFSKQQWFKEVAGQREILHLFGGVKLEDVRGMRAPFLQIGGNKMFEMLHEANFTYDSSMPVFENNPPFWPYTLDYAINHECMITPCPSKSFPGVWEVGMVMWIDLRGGRCSMGDACSNPGDDEGVYKMLLKNFNRHYKSNRAPFNLFYHSAWFNTQHHKKGFLRFLDHILAKGDVWLLTNWQLIQWIRNPTPNSRINSFEPWQCTPKADRPEPCHRPTVCNVPYQGGLRYMKTCQPCPDVYPWVGNTGFGSKGARRK